MNHAESFIFPGTRSPREWLPVRASLQTPPVLNFVIDLFPPSREHHINWDRVLGVAFLLGVSVLVWSSAGLAVAHWWK
jgi:hypothetical protein